MPTSPGIVERSVCWLEPSSGPCLRAQAQRHQYDLAETQRLAVLARAEEQLATQQIRSTVTTLAPLIAVAGILVVTLGGVGYYIWQRNKRFQGPLGEFTDEELEQLISERISK